VKKIAKSKTGPWVGPGGVNPTMPRFATGGVVKKGKAKK